MGQLPQQSGARCAQCRQPSRPPVGPKLYIVQLLFAVVAHCEGGNGFLILEENAGSMRVEQCDIYIVFLRCLQLLCQDLMLPPKKVGPTMAPTCQGRRK